MNRRITLLILLILTVIYLPWWVSPVIALVAIWRYSSGYELLIPALLIDLAYGLPIFGSLQFAFPVTLGLLFILILSKIFSRNLFFQTL